VTAAHSRTGDEPFENSIVPIALAGDTAAVRVTLSPGRARVGESTSVVVVADDAVKVKLPP